ERRQRLEARVGWLRTVYPGLRRVPAEEIPGLLQAARRDALRQWTLYAILLLAMGLASWFAFLGPLLDQPASIQPAMFLWFIPAAGTMNLFVYAHMRAFLNGRAHLRYPRNQD